MDDQNADAKPDYKERIRQAPCDFDARRAVADRERKARLYGRNWVRSRSRKSGK